MYIMMTEKKCQKNCKLDPVTKDRCLGCDRTLEEIKDAGRNAIRSTPNEDDEESQEARP